MKQIASLMGIVLTVVFATGCGKKEEPKTASGTDYQQQAKSMMDQAAKSVKETAQAFTTQINLDKTVAELKAEAENMDVASLMQVAGKYKDAIVAKQTELSGVAEKLAAIPMTQRLGDEAKLLTSETQKLTEAIKALTDRFNVYFNAVKAKGGDVSGLTL